MAALLGLAVLTVLPSPARLALAIFQARWTRGSVRFGEEYMPTPETAAPEQTSAIRARSAIRFSS